MAEYRSDRMFELWSFSPSHCTMLLRSNPRPVDGIDTRVEIYVGNVETLCVKPRMKGLTIRRPSADEAVECGRKFGLDEVRSLYLVSSGDFQGFVVGGRPSWREAVRELEDDTLFDFFGQEWPPGPEMTWGHVE